MQSDSLTLDEHTIRLADPQFRELLRDNESLGRLVRIGNRLGVILPSDWLNEIESRLGPVSELLLEVDGSIVVKARGAHENLSQMEKEQEDPLIKELSKSYPRQ